MRLKVLNIKDVAESQMCCGCGVCEYMSPDEIEMVDVVDYGRRPHLKGGAARDPRSAEAFAACPGMGIRRPDQVHERGPFEDLTAGWGPVLGLWEGFAADPELRFAGSSGGAATALALYCMEQRGMHGLLHVKARDDVPYLNETVLSVTREQVLSATGSRYAPASPCDGLGLVEQAESPCVMIGKPCDIAGAAAAAASRERLRSRLGLTIALFCAGTPSTRGTLEMLKAMGISDPDRVRNIRYRGNGWPGAATAVIETPDGEETRELSYDESWGKVLQRHRQWRCYLCPDHTGESADISVGDPWYRPIPPGDAGHSLVVARTERGRDIVRGAMAAGYLSMVEAPARVLEASQPGFLTVRGLVWGRVLTLRALGVPAPRFSGLPMFRFWLRRTSLRQKAQSVYGTARRVATKRLKCRHVMTTFRPHRALVAAGRSEV